MIEIDLIIKGVECAQMNCMIGRKVFSHWLERISGSFCLSASQSAFAVLILFGWVFLRFQLHFTSVLHAARWLSRWGVNCHLSLDSSSSELAEWILYIDVVLCAGLEEYHVAILLTELLAVESADLALLLQVYLIPNDEEGERVAVLWLRLRQKYLLPVK